MENRPPPPTADSTHFTLENQQAGGTLQYDDGDDSDAHEQADEEVDKLEEQIKEMAHKISNYRSTFPDQLRHGLAALLAAQRPQFPLLQPDSEPASATSIAQDAGSHSEGIRAAGEDEETGESIRLLKEKVSRNISAMPQVLKRMNDCISRIDKLSSRAEIIHPAFKRKKS